MGMLRKVDVWKKSSLFMMSCYKAAKLLEHGIKAVKGC